MTFFSLVLTHRISKEKGDTKQASQEKWVILPLFSLVVVMVVLTARKIYDRWRRQQVEIKIDEIV